MTQIDNSQKRMQNWIESKQEFGTFMGSTGIVASSSKKYDIKGGPQSWAKKDQLIKTQPINGGMGMQLLQKMGWKPGEGLGKEKTGTLEPLLLNVKLNKHGLVAVDENDLAKKKENIQCLC